jgi:hypothetical protein
MLKGTRHKSDSALRRSLSYNWSLQRYLNEFHEDKRLMYQSVLEKLYKWFMERKQLGKDGRWLTIIANSSIVHSLDGKCAYVVGNPPWVRIHTIDIDIRRSYYKGSNCNN